MEKSETRCPSILCIEEIKKHGENYHDVYPVGAIPSFLSEATLRCGRCGGFSNGHIWVHACAECGVQVKEDELKGLFVPHQCSNCEETLAQQEIKQGKTCSRCKKARSRCYC
jgi:hypothetical protein